MLHPLARRFATGLVALATLALVLAPAASAAPPGPYGPDAPPHLMRGHGPAGPLAHLRFLDAYLELTETQRQQARAQLEALRGELTPLRREMRTLRSELGERLDAESPDPTVVGELTLELRALRGQLRELLDAQREELRALLTTEQRSKLDHLREARHVRRQLRGHRAGAGRRGGRH